jgi:lipopolysaccharide/colanic/teichoic acid biosynthesis glycosyltransferase
MRRLARPLLYLGVAGAVIGLSKVHAVRHDYDYTASFRLGWSFAYIGLLCVAAYAMGLPEVPRDRRSALGASITASASACLAMSVVQLLQTDPLLPRFVVFGVALALVPWFVLCWSLSADLHSLAEDRVVVVGVPAEASELQAELSQHPEHPAVIVTSREPEAMHPAWGSSSLPLIEVVRAADADVLVMNRDAQADETLVAQAATLHEAGVRVRTVSLFYEEWLGKLPVGELERMSLMFDIGEVHRVRYGRLKRVLDVMVAIPGLLLLALIAPVVWVLNLAANRGPLLYRQQRVGRGGQVFTILKLRTMRPYAGDSTWTEHGDPRVTPLGRLLRSTHLDALPQVLNILRGDLSIVGPRPEQPHYVEELVEKLPFYDFRHLVRPGLTGWAQVKYGYAGSQSDALEKLQYDFYYLRRQSLSLDFRIIGRTLRSVVGGGR